jgi:transcriptional regulator GlxA family with amidase domain
LSTAKRDAVADLQGCRIWVDLDPVHDRARKIAPVGALVQAHLAAPITLARLCAVAGVGDRWLEAAFRHWRQQTPTQFVSSRRMAAARRRLTGPTANAAVTRIAHDVGFAHLSRFANLYRRTCGESSSTSPRRPARVNFQRLETLSGSA